MAIKLPEVATISLFKNSELYVRVYENGSVDLLESDTKGNKHELYSYGPQILDIPFEEYARILGSNPYSFLTNFKNFSNLKVEALKTIEKNSSLTKMGQSIKIYNEWEFEEATDFEETLVLSNSVSLVIESYRNGFRAKDNSSSGRLSSWVIQYIQFIILNKFGRF